MKAAPGSLGDGAHDGYARDLRLTLPAVACILGALCGLLLRPATAVAGVAVVVGLLALGAAAWPAARRTLAVLAVCVVAAALCAGLRAALLRAGPLADLAAQGAQVTVEAVITSDPALRESNRSWDDARRPYVVVSARVHQVTGRGHTFELRAPVTLIADESWADVRPGQRVASTGRLDRAEPGEPITAVLQANGPPDVLDEAGTLQAFAEPLRAGLRESVSSLPPDVGGLVPALVVGDEVLLPQQVRDDMQETGLTHLTAVSGANVSLLLAAVLGLARWCGVRGYWLPVVGAVCVLAFVVVARPQPSVVRAAAMGLVALGALSAGGRHRGAANLSIAVLVLVLVDPWLARSAGFALSVLATGGILFLAPGLSAAAERWMPHWVAVALAVPLGAQLACTPIVVALSDELSLVSLPANLLVAPAVGPTTVAGALASVTAPLLPWMGIAAAWVAGGAAWWIVTVAQHGADLPGAAVTLAGSPFVLIVLLLACLAGCVLLPALLRRRAATAAAGAALVVAVLRPGSMGVLPGLSTWPPDNWVLVACDVGQGDALAVRAGEGSALVVDAGGDAGAVGRCLDDLHVREVPSLVLTHFHADHVDGLAGVLQGREVGEIIISPLPDPAAQADDVAETAAAEQIPVRQARADDRRVTGEITWTVLWPRRVIHEDSMPNNASIVLMVEVADSRILLTGDVEPPAQRAILRSGADLSADVLKVPHHGSVYQEPDFLAATGARVALVSVGADNDYGHPAPETLRSLEAAGALVQRTDRSGDVAVAGGGRRLSVVQKGAALASGADRAARSNVGASIELATHDIDNGVVGKSGIAQRGDERASGLPGDDLGGGRSLGDNRARSPPRDDGSGCLELAIGTGDRSGSDTKLAGEVSDRGELVAGQQPPGGNVCLELAADLLVRCNARRTVKLDGGSTVAHPRPPGTHVSTPAQWHTPHPSDWGCGVCPVLSSRHGMLRSDGSTR